MRSSVPDSALPTSRSWTPGAVPPYSNSFLFPVVLASRFLKRFGIATGSDVRPMPSGFGWLSPLFRSVLPGRPLVQVATLASDRTLRDLLSTSQQMRIQDQAQIEIAVIGTGPTAFAVVSA